MPTIVRRIMPNLPGPGFYWEVLGQEREVLARGIADSAQQARADIIEAERRSLVNPGPSLKKAS